MVSKGVGMFLMDGGTDVLQSDCDDQCFTLHVGDDQCTLLSVNQCGLCISLHVSVTNVDSVYLRMEGSTGLYS